MANKFYAVRQGRNPGIYRTWKDCQAQVSGFPCAQFKSFPALTEAEAFLNSSAGQDMEIDGQTLTAYVDGSYDHRKKEFSYGMVIRKKEGELYFAEKYADPALASMRNVAGEIKGAQRQCSMLWTEAIKSWPFTMIMRESQNGAPGSGPQRKRGRRPTVPSTIV